MNKQYKKEKFESRDEALIWCADNKPMYDHEDDLDSCPVNWDLLGINKYWIRWHKAIEIVPEKRVIEVWFNVYPNSIGEAYRTKDKAVRCSSTNSLGIIKITKEITLIDGKVVEDE